MKQFNFIIIFLFFALVAICQNTNHTPGKVQVNNEISVTIPCAYTESPDFLKAIQKTNDKIIYLVVLDIDKSGKKLPFAVSKYSSENASSIDTAFSETIQFKPQNDSYKVLDAGTKVVKGKILRYKYTKITFEGKEVVLNLMFYFMKNGYSKDLYEIKLSFDPEREKQCKELLEQIATSFVFK
jgi:hypothetical protein